MVEHPAEYKWSSYRINAQDDSTELITPHMIYEQLGFDSQNKKTAYRELFRYQLEPKMVDEIRQATNGNYVLGDTRFAREISDALGRRVKPGRAGRPRNEDVVK